MADPTMLALLPCLGVVFKRGAWVLVGAGYSASLEGRARRTMRNACFYVALANAAGLKGRLTLEMRKAVKVRNEPVGSFIMGRRAEQPMPPASGAGVAETWFDVPYLVLEKPGVWEILLSFNGRKIGSVPFYLTP
ncbi:hypothetical protein PLCT1_01297 [Planctomycetaceae bacterium]|nr:hypothetical protein PLCT1_01297 [Planctomycetaceae bacterium]